MMDFLFWLTMAGVLVLGWPEFKAWLAVRQLRKEIKEYEDADDENRDVSHL